MIEHIIYTPKKTDILDDLNEEADLQRDGSSGASSEEIADLLGKGAEEIQRLRQEIAELLYRNQTADGEIARLQFARDVLAKRVENAEALNEVQTLRFELDRMRGEVIQWIEASNTGTKLILEQKSEILRLRAALLAVEWVEDDSIFCPWCDNPRGQGHEADCQRQLALGIGP